MNIYILLTFFKVFSMDFFPLLLGQMFHTFLLAKFFWIIAIRSLSYHSLGGDTDLFELI